MGAWKKNHFAFAAAIATALLQGQANADPSPYMKLLSVFNSAQPASLSVFPTTAAEVAKWSCEGASRASDKLREYKVPAYKQVTYMISPAKPGDGPLFPPTPEQDGTYNYIVFVDKDGKATLSSGTVYLDDTAALSTALKDGGDFGFVTTLSPELTSSKSLYAHHRECHSSCYSYDEPIGHQITKFRVKDGMILISDDHDAQAWSAGAEKGWNDMQATDDWNDNPTYIYCWLKATTPSF